VADGVRPGFTPAHPRQLQALAHHRLTGALHRAATDAPTPRQVLGVFHPVRLAPQVTDQLVDRFGQTRTARPVRFAQHRCQDRPSFGLEQLAPLAGLVLGLILGLRVQEASQAGQSLRRVKKTRAAELT
jgi:hypothetical protein